MAHRGDEVGHALSQVVDRRSVNIGYRLQLQLRIHVGAHLAAESVELVHYRRLVRAAVAQRIVLGRLAQPLPILQLLLDELAQLLSLLRQALGLHLAALAAALPRARRPAADLRGLNHGTCLTADVL